MITLEKAAEITHEKVWTLLPEFRWRVVEWCKACENSGLHVYVYEGFRSLARQAELYAMGPKVTKAKPGQSFHNYSMAIDWVPLVPSVKVDGMYEVGWDEDELYKKGMLLALPLKMRALSWETPHLEDGNYEGWRELVERGTGNAERGMQK